MIAETTPKVLLVDDTDLFLDLGKEYLLQSQIEVLTARNGEQALDAALRERPDLIFMDVRMPVMDGLTCCQLLKSDPRLREIPVVMLYSEASEVTTDTCSKVGCEGALSKPIDRQIFLDVGRAFVGQIGRRDMRQPCQAEIIVRRDGTETTARSADLSTSGMYVVSQEPGTVGESIRLHARFPGGIGTADIPAVVAWVNQEEPRKKPSLPPGFGVRFTGMNIATRLMITQVLTRLKVGSGYSRRTSLGCGSPGMAESQLWIRK